MFLTSTKKSFTQQVEKKIKKLPLGPQEKEGAERISLPKILYRKFMVKSIFLCVVARPITHRNFDVCIWLKRVSTQVTITKLTTNTNFSDDMNVNCAMKTGKRKNLFTDIDILS